VKALLVAFASIGAYVLLDVLLMGNSHPAWLFPACFSGGIALYELATPKGTT